jgi:hypothetical protein
MSEHSQSQAQSQYEGIYRMTQALDMDWDGFLDLVDQRRDLLSSVQEAQDEFDDAEREFKDANEEDADADAVEDARGTLSEAFSNLDAFDGEHKETLAQGAELIDEFNMEDNSADAMYDIVRERIQEDPLSVDVRSGWVSPGSTMEAEEFCILLCMGGPAVRIIGTLGNHGEPDYATLQHQDWYEEWTDYRLADSDVLVRYASCFYFNN